MNIARLSAEVQITYVWRLYQLTVSLFTSLGRETIGDPPIGRLNNYFDERKSSDVVGKRTRQRDTGVGTP
jgi:hypothetical protein